MTASVRHLITKYGEGGHWWAEAWVQVDLFGASWCLWRRRICIDGVLGHASEIARAHPSA